MNIGTLLLTMPLTIAAPAAPQPAYSVAPSPFLFVRVIPPGGKVAWQPGLAETTQFAKPTVVGMRPGYTYRLELSDMPDRPGVSLFPSIEVRGALQPPLGMDVSKHPVNVVLTETDLDQASRGALISKVIFLEDPNKADNIASRPDETLEYNVLSETDGMKEARERGRIVLILRLGERAYKPDELALENVPGTVLLPGAKALPIPAAPPRIMYGGIPLFDPILGPKQSTEECFHDGGDGGKRVLAVGNDGKLLGLDPSDTAIEFETPTGRKVQTSNRVCICVPRFAAFRSELSPTGHAVLRGPEMRGSIEGQGHLHTRQPAHAAVKTEQAMGTRSTLRPSGAIGQIGIYGLENLLGKPKAVAQVNGLQVVADVREPSDITGYPKCQMTLLKWVEPRVPQKIGEEVTFFLRYHNGTTTSMTGVVVSDSLTARLEYIEGSAKTDRPATFTVANNEAGSVVLRWAIDGKLLPGDSGLITFKARIR